MLEPKDKICKCFNPGSGLGVFVIFSVKIVIAGPVG